MSNENSLMFIYYIIIHEVHRGKQIKTQDKTKTMEVDERIPENLLEMKQIKVRGRRK